MRYRSDYADFFNWVELKRHGHPDEEGMYLCAFSDGTMEVMSYTGEGDTFWWDGHVFDSKGTMLTHWCPVEPQWHPDYDPSPDDQESVTRIGGWG